MFALRLFLTICVLFILTSTWINLENDPRIRKPLTAFAGGLIVLGSLMAIAAIWTI